MTVPVAPVASATSPAALAAAKAAEPVPVAPAAAPPVKSQAEIELDNTKAALARTRAELQKKVAENVTTRRASEEKVKGFGSRLSLADQHEKFLRELKVNPLKALTPYLGEKAYERIVEAQLGGGAASAEAMQLEIEKVQEGFKAELAKRDEAEAKKGEAARAEQQKTMINVARQRLVGEVDAFAKANADEYPLATGTIEASRLPRLVAQRIEAHFAQTRRVDAAGNETTPGVVLSPKEALEALENDLAAVVEKGIAAPKYAERWRTKLTPAAGSGGNAPVVKPQGSAVPPQQSQQRSVNNGLTATTTSRPERRTDQQRRADAEAAFEKARANRAQ